MEERPVTISSVELFEDDGVDVYDIQVADDESFIVGGVVVHNSSDCRIRDHKHYRNDDKHKPIGHSLPWGAGPGRIHMRCRSSSIGLLEGQKSLFGTRASVQYRDGERPKGAQVDANETYGQWLRRQPVDIQDDVLGTTKGKLFRAGKMKIEQFSNPRGKELSIEELRQRYPIAFKRAAV